jgi:hypothetical protein
VSRESFAKVTLDLTSPAFDLSGRIISRPALSPHHRGIVVATAWTADDRISWREGTNSTGRSREEVAADPLTVHARLGVVDASDHADVPLAEAVGLK